MTVTDGPDGGPQPPRWYEKNADEMVSFVCVATYAVALFLDLALSYGAPLPLLLYYLAATALIAMAGIWMLRRKRRSLWWLLLVVLPFGWIGLLSAGNRSRS